MQRSEFHNGTENNNRIFVQNNPFDRWERRCVHNTDINESVAIRPQNSSLAQNPKSKPKPQTAFLQFNNPKL